MQAEIRAEGHAGWGNTLDDAIAFIERLTSPVPAEQPKPSPCVEPSGTTGPADAPIEAFCQTPNCSRLGIPVRVGVCPACATNTKRVDGAGPADALANLLKDAAWRHRWHNRLGRGDAEPEGKFYKRLETALAGPADAGSHETLQQRAEDLWEEVGGGLCICTISTVGHWCEKCQQRIALIKDALRAASASAPAAPRETKS
jgi:hypothetical protein